MTKYIDEENAWLADWGVEEESSTDPFAGVSRTDQDLFFRMLDLMPDQYREEAMNYFMSRPSKLHAIIKNIKLKRALIKNQDRDGLNQLLAKEYAAIEEAGQLATVASDY